MLRHGDDAGHFRNGSAQDFRAETAEDRATYRKWVFGILVFYCALLLVSGVVAVVIDSSPGLVRLTRLSAHTTAASAGAESSRAHHD